MAVRERGPAAGSGSPEPPAPAAWPRRARAVIARADRPAAPGLITLLAAAGFALARWSLWARHSIGRFILIGEIFAWPPWPSSG